MDWRKIIYGRDKVTGSVTLNDREVRNPFLRAIVVCWVSLSAAVLTIATPVLIAVAVCAPLILLGLIIFGVVKLFS